MPFQIIRNDITRVKADAIVNTANPMPTYSDGTDRAIYQAAGAEELLAERKKIGILRPGDAAVTPAFRLHAKYIIHTVGPVWLDGSQGEAAILRTCYEKVLAKAAELNCESIALPLISTGSYGFPRDKALEIAVNVISPFLLEHEMTVTLVVFGPSSVMLSEKLFGKIDSFIDNAYVAEKESQEYLSCTYARSTRPRRGRELPESELRRYRPQRLPDSDAQVQAAPAFLPLDDLLKQHGDGFRERLLALMEERKLTSAQVYKPANLTKQFFSKVLSNPDYIPGKYTIASLCLAMKLSYGETQELLNTAGYTLTRSSIPDLILEYCIRNREYNVVSINILLFEKGFGGLNEGCRRLS